MVQITATGTLRLNEEVRFRNEAPDRVAIDIGLTLILPIVPGEAPESVLPAYCAWVAKSIAAAEGQVARYDQPEKL